MKKGLSFDVIPALNWRNLQSRTGIHGRNADGFRSLPLAWTGVKPGM